MKKKFRDTKLAGFLAKASEFVPGVAGIAMKVISGDSELSSFGEALKSSDHPRSNEFHEEFEKHNLEYQKDMASLEVEDRKDARSLYKADSIIQKVFAIVFLIGYAFLSWYLLSILKGSEVVNELFKTMVTMIWTGTSTKLGTIIDFLFGGSIEK